LLTTATLTGTAGVSCLAGGSEDSDPCACAQVTCAESSMAAAITKNLNIPES
jgi:hypothetical protein